MIENPATVADVQASFERPLTDDEARVVPTWLNQSWTILTRTIPGLDSRIDLVNDRPEAVPVEAVVQVLVAMVERKLRNPAGLRAWNSGDNYTETIDQALSSGQLYPTTDEIARLQLSVPGVGGFYSIPLGR
jgi:hypothetical protein